MASAPEDLLSTVAVPPYQVLGATGPQLILPNKYVEELRNHPSLNRNNALAPLQDLFTDFHGFEPFAILSRKDSILRPVVQAKMTPALSDLMKDMVEETSSSLQDIFGEKDSWYTVVLKETTFCIVSRLSSRVFLGQPLCRDKRWLAIAKSYPVDVATAMIVLRIVPSFIRPIAYWLIPRCWACRRAVQTTRKLISPEIQRSRKIVDDIKAGGLESTKAIGGIGWIYQILNDGNIDYARAQLMLTMSSVYTTSDLLIRAILDLCEHPEMVSSLREEVIAAIGGHGWTKSSLSNLKLMDSFFKESQRISPMSLTTMNRLVEEDITLSDGTLLRKGARICFMSNFDNPEVYDKPEIFDGARFFKMRHHLGNEYNWQLAATAAEYTLFGHGKHACPGRFFAVNELKILLSHFLLKYDCRFTRDGKRSRSTHFEGFEFANSRVKVEIRRRMPEINIDLL
ncbi:ent-kaurene oxidase [Thozetella sp. PMI_491]|nr:ent-kaurene oxidase [Thozetella sp. PMI_491]